MRRRSGGEGTTSIAEAKQMVGDYICMVLAYNAYFNNNEVSGDIKNLKEINRKHYDKWCLNRDNCNYSKKYQSPTDQSKCYTTVTKDVTRYLATQPLLKPEMVELFKDTINTISDRFKTQFDKSINNIEKLTQGIKTTGLFSLFKNEGYGMKKSQEPNDRHAKKEIYNHIKESSTILLSLILKEEDRVPTEATTKEEIFRKKFYEDNNKYKDKIAAIINNAETKATANTQ